jgi:plastocyanin
MLMVLLLSGCTFLGQTSSDGTNNVTDNSTPSPVVKNPVFSITSPGPSEVISVSGTSAEVQLVLNTQNLVLKNPGGVAKKGEGHFKVSVDRATPFVVTSRSYSIQNLSIGEHSIRVELFNNDGKSYSMSKEVSFTLEQEAPTQYTPQTYTINIRDLSYQPSTVTVKVGDRVNFINTGSFPNSATSFVDGKEIFNTGVMANGKNFSVTFTEVGEFEFYSVTNRQINGRIVVESNGAN